MSGTFLIYNGGSECHPQYHVPNMHSFTMTAMNLITQPATGMISKIWHKNVSYHPAKFYSLRNKKHLKNVGPIRHCEPPHAHSPGVASGSRAPPAHRCPRQ